MKRFMRAANFVLVASIAAVVVGATAQAKGPNPPPPRLTFTPGSYSFGSVAVGKSTTHAFTLRYSGAGSSGQVTVALTPDSGPFAISSNGCDGKSLTAQTTCYVTVRYAPQTVAGTDSATLTATAGALTSNQVALTGTGAPPPRLTFTPGSWDFGPVALGARASHTFTLRYSGGSQSGQIAVTLTPRRGPFTIGNNNCSGDNLDTQSSCSVTVRYAPRTVGAEDSATLTATAGKLISNSVLLSGTSPSPTPMVADPSALHFGEVPTGDFKELPLTFTNTSSTTQSLAWTSTGEGFNAEPECDVVEPGAQCVITVTFVPYSIQTYSDWLYTNWSDGEGKVTKVDTPLDGTGVAAKVSADLPTLSFKNVEVNTTSDEQTVTFTNETAATLHVSDVSYYDSQYFSDNASTACSSLAPNGEANDTCTVSVTFKPLAVGEFQAGMILTWAGADNATVTHTGTVLAGNGVPLGYGMVEASPQGLEFEWTAIGETSAAQEITLTNRTTDKTLAVLSYESPLVTVVSDNCPDEGIGPTQSCTFFVQFKPADMGWYHGTLKVHWAEPNSETAIAENDIPLYGKGYQPGMVSASATELSFGELLVSGTSAVQTVTFTNDSNTPLSMNGLRTPAGFQSTGYSNCNSETGIPHGGTCTISVTFTPTEATAYDDYLVGEWSAPGSEETLTVTKTHLTGTGQTPLSAEPAELAFGDLDISQIFPPQTKTITITNNTQSTVWMTGATPPAGFVVFGSSFMGCYYPGLGPGGQCTGLVQFWPTNAETYSGWFTTNWVTGTEADPVPVGTTSTWVTGTGVAATLTTLSINSPAYVHSNNEPNLTFTVTIDHASGTDVTFDWAANDWPDTKAAAVWGTTCDGSADYTSSANTGTGLITAGNLATTITFGTCNNGPANVYPITTPTYFTVAISNPSGATITTDTGTGEIRIS